MILINTPYNIKLTDLCTIFIFIKEGNRHSPLKVSVVDLGFNSVKLVNYIVASDNSFRTDEEFSVKTRLGEGFSYNSFLSGRAMTRAVASFKGIS